MGKYSNIVILCVGTNKIIGDCLGPIVGQKLTRIFHNKGNILIYGNMKETLNLKNAKGIIQEIYKNSQTPFIITVDAALGKKEMIENIFISTGKIKIGEALGNSVEYISQVNIKGIVGEYHNDIQKNMNTLIHTKRKRIHRLSNQIAYEIYQMVEKINCV